MTDWPETRAAWRRLCMAVSRLRGAKARQRELRQIMREPFTILVFDVEDLTLPITLGPCETLRGTAMGQVLWCGPASATPPQKATVKA